jgi:hypothetical protein
MKIRNGFVSNSSTSSFCVYGWDIEYGEGNKIKDKLMSLSEENDSILEQFYCDHCAWIGVGNQEEVDADEDGNTEYEVDEPSQELMDKLDELVKLHDLPKPTMTSGTFYNG